MTEFGGGWDLEERKFVGLIAGSANPGARRGVTRTQIRPEAGGGIEMRGGRGEVWVVIGFGRINY